MVFHCLGPHASIARCLGSTPGQGTNISQAKCPPHQKKKKKLLKMKFNFPGSSVSKESMCNAGDPSSIPGSGRSPEEGIGYPLQYSWVSLGAQLIQNPSAILWKTWARSLGWEDPLEEDMASYSSILAWRIPIDRGAWWAIVHGEAKSWI